MCIRDRLFTLWTVLLLTKLYVVTYGCVSGVAYSLYTLTAVACTYSRVKSYLCRDLNCNIAGNIRHVGRLLQSLRIKVPMTRNRIECILFVAFSFTFTSFYNYENVYYARVSNHFELFADFMLLFDPSLVVTLVVSAITLTVQCYFLSLIHI